jgi:hypothetical protein
MTYQEYITKYKGYKQIGQRHYFQYCEYMDEYINKVSKGCVFLGDIEENTKYANMYYKINVNPNFKG